MYLTAYDFVLTQQSGKRNPADMSLRRSDYEVKEHPINKLLSTL